MPHYRRFVALADAAFKQDVSALNLLALDAYKGSLDAAKALQEAVLPGWSGEARMSGFGGGQAAVWNPMKRPGQDFRVDSQDPARAWLIAILEALIAQEDT